MQPDASSERRKYEKAWADPGYRINSPGLNAAPDAFTRLGCAPGESLYDFGCGEGRAVEWFRKQGLVATGVDLVKLKPDVIEACLWDLPADMEPRDYVFSADVLEHLPPERVMPVLRSIKAKARNGAYLTVATVHDVHGNRIGETLHLTVMPSGWWLERMREVWSQVKMGRGDRDWRYWAVVGG